ncbi:MAG: hypothetical protein VKL39_01155 [Leptolyngbyaceae bacterium]|nr:hypothetical protein [Leptolyngbyaceae bacterium]
MFEPDRIQAYLRHISENRLPAEDTLKRDIFKCGLWLLGIPAILYGAVDRGLAAFSKPYLEVTDLSYCLILLVALFGWLFIDVSDDPIFSSNETYDAENADVSETNGLIHSHSSEVLLPPKMLIPHSPCIAQQSYRLPFPSICQIYHLLNLKHLEEIHRFSLGNLKVTKVSQFRTTRRGGYIRFRTMLDSPFNVLRIWRQSHIDVGLTIHTPHQIELSIPVYQQKVIHVLFNVIPLGANEHQLIIQMFSNLQWPKELLRVVLLFASSLTLLEDLPYLSRLAHRHAISSRGIAGSLSSCQSMQLFRRYVDLYESCS